MGGTLWAGLLLPLLLANTQLVKDRLFNRLKELINRYKEILFLVPKKVKPSLDLDYRTQIFIYKWNFIDWLFKRKTLKLIHVEGISDPAPFKKLKFRVGKGVVEGMEGRTFKNKTFYFTAN